VGAKGGLPRAGRTAAAIGVGVQGGEDGSRGGG
jgi:hypothetical protein